MKLSLYQGNSLDALKRMPEESVDCIVTSSPYYGLRDYSSVETVSADSKQLVMDLIDTKIREYIKKYSGYRFYHNDPQFNDEKKTWFCTIRIDIDAVWDGDSDCVHEWIHERTERPNSGGGHNSEKLQSKKKENVENFQESVEYNDRATYSSSCHKCHAWKGQLGLEPTYQMFIDHLLQITNELKRVLKPTGTLFWNMGDGYSGAGAGQKDMCKVVYRQDDFRHSPIKSNLPNKSLMMIPERLAMGMIDQGWILRNKLIWYKPNGMPSSVRDRFSNKWEYIFFFSKNGKYYFDLDSVRKPLSEGSIKRISQKNIPNQFQSGKSMEYGKTSQNMSIPKILNNMHQKYEVKGAYTGKHSGYKNLDGTEQINENGANPGDVISAKKPYAIAERTKEYVEYRNFPDIVEFSNYINEKRKELNYTIEEIEEMMDSQAPHHWFNKESYPSVRDYERLKDLLELDGRFDENLLKVYIKSSEKQNSPNGANPGDILKEPAVRHKSWVSNAGHNFTHERKYDPDADGGDFLSIATRAHPFAHFAVYPETLIEPLIKAGCPKEVCVKCGKPKERIVETNNPSSEFIDKSEGYYQSSGQSSKALHRNKKDGMNGVYYSGKTIGWMPTCDCNAGFEPGTVLDPFNGSGTTMLVARNLGRSAIGIDVNPIYSEIVKKRLQWGMGLDIEHEIIEKVLS